MLIVDGVVENALQAYQTYAAVFDTKLINSSEDLPKLEFNEVIFEIEQVRFHLFDANSKMGWEIPASNSAQPLWFNIVTDDAATLYQRAVKAGFKEIVPLKKDEELGILNGVVRDPFHYSWVIEQNFQKTDFSARRQILGKRIQK